MTCKNFAKDDFVQSFSGLPDVGYIFIQKMPFSVCFGRPWDDCGVFHGPFRIPTWYIFTHLVFLLPF
jgi:hypothetical protein